MNAPKPINALKWMCMALLAALAVAAAGCHSNEMPDAGSNNPDKLSRKMTIHVATGKEAPGTRVAYDDSKVDLTPDMALTWQTDDQLTVVRMDGNTRKDHKNDYLYKGTDGQTSGSFEGTEITAPGDSWTVYYPHTVTVNTDNGTATLPMTGQTQAANGSTAHLRNHMLLAATGLTNLADGFALEMKSSIMKFHFEHLPAQLGTLKELTWMAETATGTRNLTLKFAQGAVNPANSSDGSALTAYLAFMPQEMEVMPGGTFTVTLTGDKTYRAAINVTGGKTYRAGSRYTAEINPTDWQEIAIMALTVKVTESSPRFSIPFPTGGSTPANITVNWGDGKTATAAKGTPLSDGDSFDHTYTAPGTYTITISSDQKDETQQQIPEFNFGNRNGNSNKSKLISVDTPLLNMGERDLSSCFSGCQVLRSIPEGLFGKNIQATEFSDCFYQCSALQSVPKGLFDTNTQATTFAHCFRNCFALRNIPEGLFAKNMEATNFYYCFYNCTQLILKKSIFTTDESPYNRFAGKDMDFRNCFGDAGSSLEAGSAGTAPDLWNYERGAKAWNTAQCFAGTKNLNNQTEIPIDWGGLKTYTTMQLTVKVEIALGLEFNIPFPTSGTTPANMIVDWGDGNKSVVASGTPLSESDRFSHSYFSAGNYIITISSAQTDEAQKQMPEFNFYTNRNSNSNPAKLISVDTPLPNTGATNFVKCFYQCAHLQTIPEGLFDKHAQVTSFDHCFSDCLALKSIPKGLFDKHTQAEDFAYCFHACRSLPSIPEGLFAQNTEATNFAACFLSCTHLALNKKIFSMDESSPNTRFAGKEMNFTSCFENAGTDLTTSPTGTAPDLWNYEKGGKDWSTGYCFASTHNLSNQKEIPADWASP